MTSHQHKPKDIKYVLRVRSSLLMDEQIGQAKTVAELAALDQVGLDRTTSFS
jgi:hypothetical protein